MIPISIPKAAKEMGYCRQGALKRLKRIQKRNPDIQVLLPRAPGEHWRVNQIGLRDAVEREQGRSNDDLSHRVGINEADLRTVHRKLRRLEVRVFGTNNAGIATADGRSTEPIGKQGNHFDCYPSKRAQQSRPDQRPLRLVQR